MNKWQVDLETRSRDDVMQVCALLAKGIGKETILYRRVSVAVYYDQKFTSITKGTASGKTAVTDGLAAAFSDHHTVDNLPQDPLIEEWPCQILFERLTKKFEVAGKDTVFTLKSINFAGRYDDAPLRAVRELVSDQLKRLFKREWRRGLDLRTGQKFNGRPNSDSDIAIKFNAEEKGDDFWNARQWRIQINDPRLRTNEMAAVLDHLRHFVDRRQAELEAATTLEAEPTQLTQQ